MTDREKLLEQRIHDLEEALGTMASWMTQAQTGFGKRDAEGIWELIDKSRERYEINPHAENEEVA